MELLEGERVKEFQRIIAFSENVIPPQKQNIEEILDFCFSGIEKSLVDLEKIFNAMTDIDEQTIIAWHVDRLGGFREQLKENKYVIYLVYPYLFGLTQGVTFYKANLGLPF